MNNNIEAIVFYPDGDYDTIFTDTMHAFTNVHPSPVVLDRPTVSTNGNDSKDYVPF